MSQALPSLPLLRLPRPGRAWGRLLGAVLACGLAGLLVLAAGPARATAMVTIVDGPATVLEGSRALQAAEGLKLADESLVRTGADSRLLRVEWPDGSAADFGPDTQAMLNPSAFGTRGGRTPSVYLLRGWLKLSSLGNGANAGLVSPRVEVQPFKGAVVVMVQGDETWVFAESGGAPLAEREPKGAAAVALKNGEAYQRLGAGKGQTLARPAPPHMQRVPRGFRESLPLRSAALGGKAVAAKPAPPPGYAELRDWLAAEPALRKAWPRRWADFAKDGAFRAALSDNLPRHPEWEALLFPERFTKPAAPTR